MLKKTWLIKNHFWHGRARPLKKKLLKISFSTDLFPWASPLGTRPNIAISLQCSKSSVQTVDVFFPGLALLGLNRALSSGLGLACDWGALSVSTFILYSMLVPWRSPVLWFFQEVDFLGSTIPDDCFHSVIGPMMVRVSSWQLDGGVTRWQKKLFSERHI